MDCSTGQVSSQTNTGQANTWHVSSQTNTWHANTGQASSQTRMTAEDHEAPRRWHAKRVPSAAASKVVSNGTFVSAIRDWPDERDGGVNVTYEKIRWQERSKSGRNDQGTHM